MLVISWNVKAITGASDGRVDTLVRLAVSKQPDVLLLQEVGKSAADAFITRLEAAGYAAYWGGVVGLSDKAYSNVIAARGSVTCVDHDWSGAPWPQLLTRAEVTVGGRSIDVLTAHIPNGSGNGWRKVETFEALSRALAASPPGPRILAGDFNEPQAFLADGSMVSFGAKKLPDGSYSLDGVRRAPEGRSKQKPESHPRTRWQDAVAAVLGPGAPHGLRHAYLERHGVAKIEVTHVVQKRERFFDHVLVSPELSVEDAGFFHEWRGRERSDHSGAWALVGERRGPGG